MKAKLQNLPTAIIITVLVVFFAALLGGRASLTRSREEALALFAGGAVGQASISYDLDEIAANAHNLVTIAERYMQTEDPLLAKIREDAGIITTANPATRSLYAEDLRGAVGELSNLLAATPPLSAEDVRYRNELTANIESSYRTIENSAYNALAEEFNRELDKMPAGLIAGMTGIEKLELYDYTLLRD